MVRFVLSSAKFHATHLIGRLTVVDKLIRMHQSRRILLMQQQSQRHESLLLSSDLSIKTNPDNNSNNNSNDSNNNNNSTDMSSPIGKSSSVVKDETNSSSSSLTTTLSLTDQSLARRHLCSTIIFARRHLLPIYPKPDNMTMCFPYHYQLQSTDAHCGDFLSRLPPPPPSSSISSAMRTIKATATDQHQHQNELNNVDYYHYTQYKANRIVSYKKLCIYD